ncbi:MAG TPA: amino acid adenylation domain-containing protein, partial [Pyrinomonadaceae bacterium]|nr:amino acid adenylation domain-containing protein [Pyrinomonadaceae bacterium]
MSEDGTEKGVGKNLKGLSPERLELLARRARRLKGTAEGGRARQVIKPLPRDGGQPLPLSFAQQRLWFLDQLDPDSTVFNLPDAVRLCGPLDVQALERSLDEIVRRHEVLRTSFVSEDGQPRALVAPEWKVSLPVIDLRDLPAAERLKAAERAADAEAWRPFDLSTGPLLRVRLLRLDEEEYVFLLTMHHIVSDAWSRAILIRELGALYEAFTEGRPSPLEELPVQYADFAAWQRERLSGETLEANLAFWKRQLASAPAALELPTDRPRQAAQGDEGKVFGFTLPAELADALGEFSRREGVTFFMVLLAAFKTLLSRYTRQFDIVVGMPTAGRSLTEVEGLIGFFVNTLVLRTDLSGDPGFRELLARVRDASLQAFAHEDVPVEKIVEELQPGRSLDRNPLWQVMFALQNAPAESAVARGLTLSPFKVSARTKIADDIYFGMVETEHGLAGSVEYRSALFDEARIERLVGHFRTLLEGAVASPDSRLSELPLLTEAERRQLIEEWNATRVDYAPEEPVQRRFERQAARTPEAVAVVSEGERVTYGALNECANRLAHRLRRLGVGPDVLVGLCLERSIEMVVAVLGILKAGGAYVPLDPAYPPDRLRFMLEDTRAPIILTQQSLRDKLDAGDSATLLCLDSDWDDIASESAADPPVDVAPDNLLYAIYTSGSTGRPKGISLSHRALRNLLEWHYENFADGPRTLQFASISFDASFKEIFSTLSTGGTLYMISEALRRDVPRLAGFIAEAGLEKMVLPVVVLQQLAEEYLRRGQFPPSLREIITTGEQLRVTSAVGELFKHLPGCNLFNHYGPAETHVVTALTLGNRPDEWPYQPSVGFPISNTQIYLLDRHLRSVPLGVAGELYIGGTNLARGYLNRPALTAERFVPNPFSAEPGARLYRTGDLARYLADGQIEFLGRLDHQVKIRGFRVEVGEVEAAIEQHEAVSEVVVEARAHDGAGDKRLVAYVVAGGSAPSASELRAFLKERLPDYMIPAAFVSLAALPLTPNGKVDRKALPEPGTERPSLETAYVAPRGPAEQVLADIWAEVLKVGKVGAHDNFLELGGDSILSIQVVSRANRAGLPLTLSQLWRHQTIAGLASLVPDFHPADGDRAARPPDVTAETGEGEAPSAAAETYRAALENLTGAREDVEDVYPLSPMQQGILFHSLFNPSSGEYVEMFSSTLEASLNVAAFRQAWEWVVARHTALRTSFVWDGLEKPLQLVHRSARVGVEEHDLRQLPPDERAARFDAIFQAEQQRGTFDLSATPLLRLYLFRMDEETYRFVWSFHDIVIDGWSAPLILEEVREYYLALSRGAAPPPPEAPPYRDFIEWLGRQDLSGAELFWRRALAGLRTPTLLAPDATDEGAEAPVSYGQRRVRLTRQTTTRLQAFTRRHHVTLNTLVQGAWALLVGRLCGEDEVLFGSVVSGRPAELPGVEATVGVLVNTLPVRVRLDFGARLSFWLRELQAAQVEARQFEFTPLVQIHKWSEIPPGQSLFDSIVAFVNYPEGSDGFWSDRDWHWQKSGYPVFFVIRPDAELLLEITHDARRIGDSEVVRILDYFREILERVADADDPRLSELPLAPAGDRARLSRWNRTAVELPLHTSFAQQFEEQVGRTPDAVAVACEGRRLTYAQLNARADGLAWRLSELGVGPETVVSILEERGIDFLSVVLGIFKAGGAYLPLDPAHPPARLAQIIGRSGTPFVLTSPGFEAALAEALDELPRDARPRVLRIAELAGAVKDAPSLGARGGPHNLAYVIYTSGSTGEPKGAMIERRGMLNHLYAKIFDLKMTADDTVAQTASQCFDISVWQFLSALLVGGRVHVFKDEIAHEPARLLESVEDEAVTVFETVPSMLRMLVEEVGRRGADRPALGALRWMIPTGEALPPELCARWLGHYPHVPLVNAYGPTECSDDVTHSMIELPPSSDASSCPVGFPVLNTRLYVLDSGGRVLPVGSPGELHVGGAGVGRGYRNDGARTAEVFVPDPFSEAPGARLYRTGDLARYLADGQIEFLGRLDHQVKIRGFRIELGEIETALGQHPSVRECVVHADADGAGDKRLIAYVVAGGSAPSASELRAFLKERLPDYMIPAAFVSLAALPLTPNGKLDRKALPRPDADATVEDEGFFEPQTPT